MGLGGILVAGLVAVGGCDDGHGLSDWENTDLQPVLRVNPSPIGGPCGELIPCAQDASCYPEEADFAATGFLGGYCLKLGCDATSCPQGATCVKTGEDQAVCLRTCATHADCRAGYQCHDTGKVCFPACGVDAVCPDGHACREGVCARSECDPGTCPAGEVCLKGQCIEEPGNGPGANSQFPLDNLAKACPGLPSLACKDGPKGCGQIAAFAPVQGAGYVDYPENGETPDNQYRSYLRRDTALLVKYAAGYVDCLARGWKSGNGQPIGLIDMSEKDGSIPGTSIGQPGHPEGTHVQGHDIDIAYYQLNTKDNRARPICEHSVNGNEAYHCTQKPHLLDPWRTALFLGALLESPNVRVVGMDGQVGGIVSSSFQLLCDRGWIQPKACQVPGHRLAFEETNKGMGWFLFHHHHLHLSFAPPSYRSVAGDRGLCLIPGCDPQALQRFVAGALGQAPDPMLQILP